MANEIVSEIGNLTFGSLFDRRKFPVLYQFPNEVEAVFKAPYINIGEYDECWGGDGRTYLMSFVEMYRFLDKYLAFKAEVGIWINSNVSA